MTEEEIVSLRDEYENKETTLYQAIEFIVAMEEGDKEKSLADVEKLLKGKVSERAKNLVEAMCFNYETAVESFV